MLTAIAAFAETFVNPLAPVLTLGMALVLPSRWQVRLVAGAAGCVFATLANLDLGPADLAMAMLGGALALLLHAEIALHLILPGLRWVRHCVVTTWELAWLVFAMFGRLWARPRPQAPAPREKDGAP